MIAVDTNLLVYAHRSDSAWHSKAKECVMRLAEGPAWSVPWPCIHEFLAIVTHPKIFDPPTPVETAIATVEEWLKSPTVTLLCETSVYWERLSGLLASGHVSGPRVHDARIAALCLTHGADELWTADRDFGRFPELRTRNPLV